MRRFVTAVILALALGAIVLGPASPARSTVNEVTAANRYVGNGSTTAFTYGFKIFANTDIEVLVDGTVKTLTTHYTVSGVGASGGGTVTFVTAPASGTAVTLLRKQKIEQQSDYIANETFSATAERIEKDVDKLAMQAQMLQEQLDRAIRFAKKSAKKDIDVPDPAADKYLRWNSTADGLVNSSVATSGSLGLPVARTDGGTGSATGFADVVFAADYANFNAAITAIGSNTRTLVIASSSTVTTSVTSPSNVTLWFVGTGQLSVNSGQTLTIAGAIIAPLRQIFAGDGTVAGAVDHPNNTVYPEWFGALGDDLTNDTAKINAAIAFAAVAGTDDGRRTVRFSGGRVYRGQNITLTSKPVTLKGDNYRSAYIKQHTDSDHVIVSNNVTDVTGLVIEDLQIACLGAATYSGIYLKNSSLFSINRNSIALCFRGILLDVGSTAGQITNNIIGSNNAQGIRLLDGANNNRITGNWINENTAEGIYSNANGNIIANNNFSDNGAASYDIQIDASGKNTIIAGNHFLSDFGAIEFSGDNNLFTSNFVSNGSGASDVIVHAAADSTVIAGNKLAASAVITNNGTNTVISQADVSGGATDFVTGIKVASDANLIYASYYFTGTPAATNQVFFLPTRAMKIKTVSQIHSTAAGGVSTLDVVKDTSTDAPCSGTVVTTAAFNLNATANTVQNGTLAADATITLAAGNRLCVKYNHAIQASVGVVVSVGMAPQ